MIITKLNELYERLLAEGNRAITPDNFNTANIAAAIIISKEGDFIRIEDIREEFIDSKGKKRLKATAMSVPFSGNRTSGVKPFFLCDKCKYLFGCEADTTITDKSRKCFEASKAYHESLIGLYDCEEFNAVCKFFSKFDSSLVDIWKEDKNMIKNILPFKLVFRIENSVKFVHETPSILSEWSKNTSDKNSIERVCAITGEVSEIADLHEVKIKGLGNAMGDTLVSFNADNMLSYGKDGGANCSISKKVSSQYAKALNYLLRAPQHNTKINDTFFVYWTDAPSEYNDDILTSCGICFEPPTFKSEDSATLKSVDTAVSSIKKLMSSNKIKNDTKFYVLGINTNSTRVCVNFFYESTLEKFITNVKRHQDNLRFGDYKYDISTNNILYSCKKPKKSTNSKNTDGSVKKYSHILIDTVLNDRKYPDALAQKIINRIKVQPLARIKVKSSQNINIKIYRCAYLKAWLIKNHNINITMTLDKQSESVGYNLGRLLAVYEKTQYDVLPNINKTISDRYFSSFMSSPTRILPLLIKLNNVHNSKLKRENIRYAINHKKVVSEIMEKLSDVPSNLSFKEQSLFYIGYNHQMNDFYTSKTTEQQ